MPIAAHTTGGNSTLDLVLGIAILLWALASVSALLGWLTRLPGRYRKRTADHRQRHSGFARLRRRERVGGDTDPGRRRHGVGDRTCRVAGHCPLSVSGAGGRVV